jgi:hypothetical protein
MAPGGSPRSIAGMEPESADRLGKVIPLFRGECRIELPRWWALADLLTGHVEFYHSG